MRMRWPLPDLQVRAKVGRQAFWRNAKQLHVAGKGGEEREKQPPTHCFALAHTLSHVPASMPSPPPPWRTFSETRCTS